MYLYFDSTGTLKEIVNDSKARQGSDNVNKLYFYFEDASAYSAIALTIKYPDGTTSTPYVITSNVTQVTFPESLNKLSYFVEGKEYRMYYYTLSSTDLAQSGMCSATVVAYTGGSANAYGLFTFQVEQSVLAENITLTQTDLTYILEQIANVANDISVYVSLSEPTSIVSKLGKSQQILSPTTLGENSVELGKNAEASANGTIAIGEGATANAVNSNAIGNYAYASGVSANAIGGAIASGDNSNAMGYGTEAYAYATAIGYNAKARSNSGIAIGNNVKVNTNRVNDIVIGHNLQDGIMTAVNDSSAQVIIGYANTLNQNAGYDGDVIIGSYNTIDIDTNNSTGTDLFPYWLIMGNENYVKTWGSGIENYIYGYKVNAARGIFIGGDIGGNGNVNGSNNVFGLGIGIGYNLQLCDTTATDGSFVIGMNSKATGDRSGALGYNAWATADKAWQIGEGVNSDYNSLQFMGRKIVDYNVNRVGAQRYAIPILAGGTTGQVLKKKSNTNYEYEWGDVASGETVYVPAGTQSITSTISNNNNAGTRVVTLGQGSQSKSADGIAIGYLATINDNSIESIVMGCSATSNALYGTAIGTNALVQKDNGIAIGQLATSNGVQSVVIGVGQTVNGNYSVGLLGSVTGAYSTAIGLGYVTGDESIAIGGAGVVSNYAIGIGAGCVTQSTRSVVIGFQNGYPDGFTADNVIAIGQNISAVSTSSIAIGTQARAYGTYSIALGKQARAELSNSVQLGTGYNDAADTLQFMNCVVAENDTDLALDITSSIDNSTYVMTLNLVGKYSEYDSLTNEYSYKTKTISTTTVDLPLEEMVINGSYDDNTQSIILTLKSGTTISIPVGDLVSGLQTQSNTLDSISLLPTNQTGLIKLTNGIASLDTTTYATTSDLANYQPLNSNLTSISGLANNVTGLIKLTNGVASLDTTTYLTSSDLSNYVTTTDLSTELSNYVTTTSLNTTLSNYATTSALSNYVTTTSLNTTLTDYVTSTNLSLTLANYVLKSSISGGTTGQVLTKDSNSDGDYSWQDPSGVGAYTFKNYISTNVLPVSPQKGDTYESDSASPLVFTIGSGGGTLQAIAVNDVFNQGDYVYFDNSITDADMLTFLQGLTYVDGTCSLVTCEDENNNTLDLVTAINMNISEDPEDPQIIYALACYSNTNGGVAWVNDGSAMGLSDGWQLLTADGGFLLDYPDGEQSLTVTTLNTSESGWNGVIVFNMVGGSSITLTLNKGDWLCYNGTTWQKVDNQEYASTSYVDNLVGDINSILDAINGEVI